MVSTKVVFTGLYRHNSQITNFTLDDRIDLIRKSGIDEIYWYVWKGFGNDEVAKRGVKIVETDEPFPHVRGIMGRQRQIYNFKKCLPDFYDDDIILKLRWDLDFTPQLLQNVVNPNFFDRVDDGAIKNKVWTGFYSVQELFSPADVSFAGFKRDLDKIINFDFKINGVSSNNYISHDGMMLMPYLMSLNEEVSRLIKSDEPIPNGLMYENHYQNMERWYDAWAYSYFLLYKYFKTGPLGTCYFKRGDMSRWPNSIVHYDFFQHNYDTMIGRAPKLGLYPRYRVYDDVFISRLVAGYYQDEFAQNVSKIINEKYIK